MRSQLSAIMHDESGGVGHCMLASNTSQNAELHTASIRTTSYTRIFKMAAKNITAKLSFSSKAKLSDGNLIPRLGLGVYEMSDAEASRAVTWALEAGYRHFDW